MNVLVVDDDTTHRKLLRVKLEQEAGFCVLEARDGMEGLLVLARERVDAIISDVLMPRLDGYQFCSAVRKDPRFGSLPFIIYTSTFVSPGDERLAREVGADEYLKKPSPTTALLQALDRAAAERRRPQAAVPQIRDELPLLKEYNELLVRKLEEKHRDLLRQTQELRQSEQRSRMMAAIVESSNDAIISKSLDGTILSWNAGATRLFGYAATEVIGLPITMIIPPEGLDEWRVLNERIQRGESVPPIETVRVRKDGSRVNVALSHSPVKDDRGEIVAISAVARDITIQKSLERELKRREQRLSAFFGAATAGLAIVDSELRFVQVNEALAAMNGRPASEHRGKTIREVVPNIASVLEPLFQNIVTTGKPVFNFEVSGETAAQPGVRRHWVASYFPIQTEGDKPEGLGAVVVEITDRQRAQEGLQRSRHQLRALAARLQAVREEERARISREIHDELGQMLTGLKMDLRWIENKIVQLSSDKDQGAITQKLRDAIGLTDATVSSIQRIAADLRPSVLDNLGLIVALGFEAKRFEERAGIRFAMTVPEESPPMDREVATAIFRIFQEALTNVARHANATHIEIRLRSEGDLLVLEVQDNGKGISTEALGAPTALGLLGMSERAASLGGHFCVQGAPGKGTTVIVQIPRARRSGP